MFRNRELNHKISRLHDTCFRLVYHDISLSEELLKKDNFFSTHYRNIQFLVTEMFRVYKRMSPKIMNRLLPTEPTRHQPVFSTRTVNQLKVFFMIQNH